MSTLKHEIRQKQAHFNSLETSLLRSPRPLPPSIPSPPGTSPEPPLHSPGTPSIKVQRRASADVLAAYTANGPDSYIPLPTRSASTRPDEIKEGVPLSFGVNNLGSSQNGKRSASPTRTLSRNARMLAEENHVPPQGQQGPEPSSSGSNHTPTSADLNASTTSSLQIPTSPMSSNPNRRSMGGAGTSKVLADLQTGVLNARNALENTKAQLRLSQRTVAQLTRQVEDLKDGRERLRLENEGLNNVVARKERLLQEVLERARKAEAEAQQLKTQFKTESTASKKAVREMESQLTESQALSQKSEREYITLKASIKDLVDGWHRDLEGLKADFAKREEAMKKEAEEVAVKYRSLMKLVQATQSERARLAALKEEKVKVETELENNFRAELESLKEQVSKSSLDQEAANKLAESISEELARFRRLIRSHRSSTSPTSSNDPIPTS
ncbi:hypothetical protein SISNIDRAFT_457377 [Sistotremastrum niveocremeum HHB9708]|uniref:SWI5-dependent HO expression protein 3 n=1 Tax=Sistotremastrum niveocremeum HHB9708 TaxID=1314777 RepID=A0A164RQ38_9AGAM|nr:hypothetical protein SISNIDRAFT_457377 [Sistotremastrum niveocremeum HHB9708]